MKVLAVDTATALAGVAVLDSEGERAAVRQERVSTHSETLLVLIDACLRELALRPADLTGIVCGSGPGSFTGLRIGAATAKGLAYALDLPLVLVSSLQTLAAQAPQRLVLAALDAFRGQVYARLCLPEEGGAEPHHQSVLQQVLAQHPQLLRDTAWDPGALAAVLTPLGARLALVGDGAARYPQLLVPGSQRLPLSDAPPPLVLARLGMARLGRGEQDDRVTALPNYAALSAPEVIAERRAGTTYYLALGSNLGDRRQRLRFAVERLATLGTVTGESPVYQTAPQGGPPQPDYLNQVVRLRSQLGPEELLSALLEIEAQAGRVRQPGDVRNGPRTLDLDILLMGASAEDEGGQGQHHSPRLTIPHPRLHQRTFVLAPLLALAPGLIHPVLRVPLQPLHDALLREQPSPIALDVLERLDLGPRVV